MDPTEILITIASKGGTVAFLATAAIALFGTAHIVTTLYNKIKKDEADKQNDKDLKDACENGDINRLRDLRKRMHTK